jgi:hypothetical protein
LDPVSIQHGNVVFPWSFFQRGERFQWKHNWQAASIDGQLLLKYVEPKATNDQQCSDHLRLAEDRPSLVAEGQIAVKT